MLKRAVTKFKGQLSDSLSSANDSSGHASTTIVNSTSQNNNNVMREKLVSRLNGAKSISQVGNLMEAASVGPKVSLVSSSSVNSSSNGANGNRWKLVRQRSQQMLQAFTSTNPAASNDLEGPNSPSPNHHVIEISRPESATTSAQVHQNVNLRNVQPSQTDGSEVATSSSAVASTMMHDFNLSMSEYRTEIRENIMQLDAKISRLENVIVNLSEKLPLISRHAATK